MVSGRRPLWICKIKRRVSLNKFKRDVKKLLNNDEDVFRVLRGAQGRHVYKVEVETMEDCENDCHEDIWVPEELARATGDMCAEFDVDEEIRAPDESEDEGDDDEVPEDVEKEYQKMREREMSETVVADESDDDLTDLDEHPNIQKDQKA